MAGTSHWQVLRACDQVPLQALLCRPRALASRAACLTQTAFVVGVGVVILVTIIAVIVEGQSTQDAGRDKFEHFSFDVACV